MPKKLKYEYMKYTFEPLDDWLAKLNSLGQDGWQVITVNVFDIERYVIVILMREL